MSKERARADNVEFVPVKKPEGKDKRSAQDQASIDELFAKRGKRKPKVKLLYNSERSRVSIDGDDEGIASVRLLNSLGACDGDFADAIARQVTNLASFSKDGTPTTERLNEVLTQALSLKPQDETEAMLVVQMTALHEASIRAAGAFGREGSIEGLAMLGRTLAKLTKAYAHHVETLQRKRAGNVQMINVHHKYEGGGGKKRRVTS